MGNECKMCHVTMSIDEGAEPTEICHDCAHFRVDFLQPRYAALAASPEKLVQALKLIKGNHDKCCEEDFCTCPSCIADSALFNLEAEKLTK